MLKKKLLKLISKTRKNAESDAPKKKIWTTSEISKLKAHEFENLKKK